jgi:photosystem II stability/assembly factor-like uncharacterized protein
LVFFLDAARGWAVGGTQKPYTQSTAGVTLRTVDGGATWTAVAADQGSLPALFGVRFFDTQHGIAYGAPGPMSPSGVYATRDGGATWQPLACEGAGHWFAGDFLAPDAGAVAGPNGRFATIALTQVVDSPLASGSLRSLRAMRLVAPTGGWLVGDGGFVATTNDLGHSWQSPSGEFPTGAAGQFDFCAVAVDGPRVWIAGSPGTRVFQSPDNGQTWQSFATGQTAPLRAIAFVDADHGWAVGELGAILATQDGGRTWQTQRTGGKRAALLAIFARPDAVPLELLAQQGAAEGYLAAVDISFRAGITGAVNNTSQQTPSEARTREAMLLAGATSVDTAWRFPLPPDDLALEPADILAALNRANDGRAAEFLQGHLVRQIRMWRPEVIVTHHGRTEFSEPLNSLIQQLTLKSIDAAADPQQHAELADVGLDAWQVKRVYGVLPPALRGVERISAGQFSPMLGATLADWSAPARRLLFASRVPAPDTFDLELLTYSAESVPRFDENAQPVGRGMFRDIALAPGSDARRRFSALPAGDIDQLRRLAARRRNLEELLQRTEGNTAWAAQVVQLTEGLEATGGGDLVFQLADGYRNSGRLDLAADTYYLLARNYPEHPLTEQALRWLVQFYASSEARMRVSELGLRKDARIAYAESDHPSAEVAGGSDSIRQASAESPIQGETRPAVGLSPDQRLRRAVELGKYLEAARPALFAEPGVRFPIVAAERQLGFANPAKRYFLALAPLPANDPWKRCAETEQWLSQPGDSPPPKPLGHSRRAVGRPFLDGRLDEPIWQTTEPIRIASDSIRRATTSVSPSGERTGGAPAAAEVRIAYDEQFLYLAVRCPKSPGVDYRPDDRPRPRDAGLAAHDRVALRFDVDRDYTTHFELVVDHRGWTQDACWGDASWNPSWYVAAAQDAATWTVEAAVPLAEISAAPIQARTVWALSARQTIPRLGHHSWAGTPDDDDSPDQYGLLIFD